MTHSPRMPDADQASRQGRGCLFWGLVSVGILAIIFIVSLGIAMYRMHTLAEGLTAKEPAEMPEISVSESEAEAVADKTGRLMQAIETGNARTFRFDQDDVNTLIETNPAFKELRGKVYVRIRDGIVTADASIPLKGVPTMGSRYLNGTITVDVSCRDGVLEVYPTDVRVKGESLPEAVMKDVRTTNFAARVYENPDAVGIVKQLEQCTVEDDHIVIRTREGVVDAPPRPGPPKKTP